MNSFQILDASPIAFFFFQLLGLISNVKISFVLSGCKDTQQADFYFLVDGSTSIWQDDFQRMKTFLKDVIKLFTIGPDAVRFGVVQYSYATTIKVEFELHDHNTSINLEKAINNINQVYGDTYTGAALTFMQSLLEKARHYVPRYLIVLTDGKAHDDVTVPAEALRRANVTLYAIGVKDANKQELHEIAGSEKQVYLVYDFASLKDIKQSLVQAICSEEGKRKTPGISPSTENLSVPGL